LFAGKAAHILFSIR